MRSRGWVCISLVLVVALGAAPVASASVQRRTPKKHWDERIQPFVDFVEHERGLEFEHPVPVDFLADLAFTRALHAGEEPTKQDRADIRRLEGQFRALGLAAKDFDVLEATSAYDDDLTVGFYDPERKRMAIRGRSLDDVETRVTVVHELTHALQDQRFDFDRLYRHADTSGEVFALDALTEGDATAVEGAYVDTLSQREQDEYYGITPEGTPPPEVAIPDSVPPALAIYYDAPYALGLSFVWLLDTDGGNAARNQALRKGVRSDEQVIDPVAWEQRQRPEKVAAPKLGPGERRRGEADEFGALTLYLVLASHVDARTALDAATGWGGDRFVGFEQDGKACIRAAFRGDTDEDTDEIAAGLEAWTAARPPGAAKVERKGPRAQLTACEAEGGTAPTAEVLDAAFYDTLDYRVFTTAQLMDQAGLAVADARCVADALATNPTVHALERQAADEGVSPDQLSGDGPKRYVAEIDASFQGCGLADPTG